MNALRVSGGIVLFFLGPRHWMGWGGSVTRPGRLYSLERPGTHFTGSWVGPRAGLDGRKISSPPGFDQGPSSPWSVAIPTELPGINYEILVFNFVQFFLLTFPSDEIWADLEFYAA